jgi:hypothetical protein
MQRNVQPDTQIVEKIRGLVTERGITRAAKTLDLNPQTVIRMLSGLSVNAETVRVASANLPETVG